MRLFPDIPRAAALSAALLCVALSGVPRLCAAAEPEENGTERRVSSGKAGAGDRRGESKLRRLSVTEKLRLQKSMEQAKFPRGKVAVKNCFYLYELSFPGRDEKFSCEVSFVSPDRMKRELKQDEFVLQMTLFDGHDLYSGMGRQGAVKVVSRAERALAEAELRMLSPAVSAMEVFDEVEAFEGDGCYLLRGEINGIPLEIRVDGETFLPSEYRMDVPSVAGSSPALTRLSEYAVVRGINLPHRQHGYMMGMRVDVRLKRLTINTGELRIP